MKWMRGISNKGCACRSSFAKGENTDLIPLGDAKVGEDVKIEDIFCGNCFQQKLFGMGIHKGSKVKVLRKMGRNSMLIDVNGSRFALGGGMVDRIFVKRLAEL